MLLGSTKGDWTCLSLSLAWSSLPGSLGSQTKPIKVPM